MKIFVVTVSDPVLYALGSFCGRNWPAWKCISQKPYYIKKKSLMLDCGPSSEHQKADRSAGSKV